MIPQYMENIDLQDGLIDLEGAPPQETHALISNYVPWSRDTASTSASVGVKPLEDGSAPFTSSFKNIGLFKDKLSSVWDNAESQVTKAKLSLDDARDSFQSYILSIVFLAVGGAFCLLSMIFLPIIVLAPHKFSLLFTIGSLLILNGLAMLKGYVALFRHLIQPTRCVFSLGYILSLISTLIATLKLRSYLLTLISATLELICLVLLGISYVAGGGRTLSFLKSQAFTAFGHIFWDRGFSLL